MCIYRVNTLSLCYIMTRGSGHLHTDGETGIFLWHTSHNVNLDRLHVHAGIPLSLQCRSLPQALKVVFNSIIL